jgi:hypothetical protein
VRVDNSLRKIFPNITRQIIGDYSFKKQGLANILYIYNHQKYDDKIYEDDLNSSYLDMD